MSSFGQPTAKIDGCSRQNPAYRHTRQKRLTHKSQPFTIVLMKSANQIADEQELTAGEVVVDCADSSGNLAEYSGFVG